MDQGKRAIGIILSGTGTDGAEGITALKQQGGFVLVQDPITALYPDMPAHTVATGLADLILAPEAMPKAILHYIGQNGKNIDRKDSETGTSAQAAPIEISFQAIPENSMTDNKIVRDGNEENTIVAILDLLKNQLPFDFSDYKRATIFRRIRKRMDHH